MIVVAVAAAFAVVYFRAPAEAPEMRVEITTPPTPDPNWRSKPGDRKLQEARNSVRFVGSRLR